MSAGAIEARWICEQAHQRLKEELGLDHFEDRSWIGLHRHALMTMIANAFLQTRSLAKTGWKKQDGAEKRVSAPSPRVRTGTGDGYLVNSGSTASL